MVFSKPPCPWRYPAGENAWLRERDRLYDAESILRDAGAVPNSNRNVAANLKITSGQPERDNAVKGDFPLPLTTPER